MKITIVDVAKKAGVSKTTVSRIINGNYDNATEETVERVLKVIDELNYRPNALAKGLKQAKTNVIGIVLSNLFNPFWVEVLEGVENTCRSLGYSLMICNSNEDPAVEEEHIRSFRLRQVDGIIINPTTKNSTLFQSLVEEKYPLVAINRNLPDILLNAVVMNNVRGAKIAVEHLLHSGRRNIALIVYPPFGITPRLERIEGYRQALREQGMTVKDSWIRVIDEDIGRAKEETKRLLAENTRPDAIFSTNNMMSLEVLEGIKEMGLRVPEDVALVGYDETVWSKHLKPSLTTVKQPAFEMGECATKRLIELIESKEHMVPTATILDPHIIIRESSVKTYHPI